MRKLSPTIFILTGLIATALGADHSREITLVEKGAPKAVVVTASAPSPIAAYAAEELVKHIELATGARLAIIGETEVSAHQGPKLFVGATLASRELGLEIDNLGPDEFALRAKEYYRDTTICASSSGFLRPCLESTFPFAPVLGLVD